MAKKSQIENYKRNVSRERYKRNKKCKKQDNNKAKWSYQNIKNSDEKRVDFSVVKQQ